MIHFFLQLIIVHIFVLNQIPLHIDELYINASNIPLEYDFGIPVLNE